MRKVTYIKFMSIIARPPHSKRSLLVVAHGDGGEDPQDWATRRLWSELSEWLSIPVAWCALRRPETVIAARATLPATSKVIVYPYFMTEGRFVREKLPRMLADAGFSDWLQLPPFGKDPALADHLEQRLQRIATALHRERADLAAALIAHGSATGDAGSRLGTEAIAEEMRRRGFARVTIGFIEEMPFYDGVIRDESIEAVIGLFVTSGTHAVRDVEGLVAECPWVKQHVTAIGLDEAVTAIVVNALRRELGDAFTPYVRQPE